jgi:hypothetical protein
MLHQIKVNIHQPGFRAKGFYIITTLLDSKEYKADDLADLYFQRWDVELFFRDIKTTMGMYILRCKTPGMIRKEIVLVLIAYNGIRYLMVEAAVRAGNRLSRISFKGNVQALRQWEPISIRPKKSSGTATFNPIAVSIDCGLYRARATRWKRTQSSKKKAQAVSVINRPDT